MRRLRDDSGVAMVEFALVIGLLLYLILGAVSFGVLLATSHGMNEAVGEAARAAALAGATPGNTERVAAGEASLESSGYDCAVYAGNAVECTVTVDGCLGDPGNECVTVELVHDRDVRSLVGHLPLIESVLPDELKASATAMVSP